MIMTTCWILWMPSLVAASAPAATLRQMSTATVMIASRAKGTRSSGERLRFDLGPNFDRPSVLDTVRPRRAGERRLGPVAHKEGGFLQTLWSPITACP